MKHPNQILINRFLIIDEATDVTLVNRKSAIEALAVHNEWKNRWSHKKDLSITFHQVTFFSPETFGLIDLTLDQVKALAREELNS
jgi:hypothetical protein